MIRCLLVGYEACSTGRYFKPAQNPWLEEGDLSVVVLLNTHTTFDIFVFTCNVVLLSTLFREA